MENYKKRLMNQLIAAREELNKLPAGKLLCEEKNGRKLYIHAYYDDEKYIRKWITKKPELIKRLARKQYLLLLIDIMERNIACVEQYQQSHVEISAHSVMENMPIQYKDLPDEYFFCNSLGVYDAGMIKEEEMRALRLWAEADYERIDYMEWEKKHRTTRGLKVRSKSELTIVQLLYQYDDYLALRYEEVIHIGEKTLIPDFVIMTRSGKKYYWEHAGLISNPNYLKRHMEKLELYASAGITMWNNLIVTYDDEDGNLDAGIIESIIKTLLVKD